MTQEFEAAAAAPTRKTSSLQVGSGCGKILGETLLL
jgi:hypothetical protein